MNIATLIQNKYILILWYYYRLSYVFVSPDEMTIVHDNSLFSQNLVLNSSSLLYKKNNYTKEEDEQNMFQFFLQKMHNESILDTFLKNIKSLYAIPKCHLHSRRNSGSIQVDSDFENLETVEKRFKDLTLIGGYFRPMKCTPKYKIAIVVPFRDRLAHLPILLKNIHPFLIRQNIEYQIFIVEQTNRYEFNRGALFNVGFLEASKMKLFECFIFHDIDLLPLDNRNYYDCPDQPRHLSVAIDVLNFKLPYQHFFGGVSSMQKEQFSKVNGFSNSFWGWGGEDDDMFNRISNAKYIVQRYSIKIARYAMLNHTRARPNPKRFSLVKAGLMKFSTDGLNSIKYEILKYNKFPLFTWFLVDLKYD